jgi:hypothetical protein
MHDYQLPMQQGADAAHLQSIIMLSMLLGLDANRQFAMQVFAVAGPGCCLLA